MTKLELLSLLVTTAALFGWVSRRWLRLPLTIGTMLLTFLASLALLALGNRYPALDAWAAHLIGAIDFEALMLHGMLPLLLFAGAFLMDLGSLVHEKLTVTLLALPGTLLAAAAVALLMHSLLPFAGLRAPWLDCLFFGVLIAPTDPIAVLELLRRVGIPANIQAQLAGESLFNDGVGAVLFLALLEAAHGDLRSAPSIVVMLVLKAGGGLLLGIVLAWIVSRLMHLVDAYQVEILLTLALALASYTVADRLHVSGPLASVAAGIALRAFSSRAGAAIAHARIDQFWEVADEVQNSILFVLLGLEVLTVPLDRSLIGVSAVSIVTVVGVRVAVVALMLGLLRLLQPGHASSLATLSWGGLRAGLSLALALAVPITAGRYWILAATYATVIFSVAVQGGLMDTILPRLTRRTA